MTDDRQRAPRPYPPKIDHFHSVHGVWTGVAVAGVAFSLVISTIALTIVATRPAMDQSTMNAMAADAISNVIGAADVADAESAPSAVEPPVVPAPAAGNLGEPVPSGFFTLSEIALHNDATTSCWVIVDGLVFDLTEAARLHPSQFKNCGGDSSEVYHRQHGPVIRDKMMTNKIGEVWDAAGTVAIGTTANDEPALAGEGCPPEDEGGPINPKTTLFVEAGTWDVKDLMLVVEKECRSVLFIDGVTHSVLGRIDDLGHQLHAPTPSPDGAYVYVIARDGWLSKIDLSLLEVEASIDVGVSSRGTGLTDDGKYLLVGNFEPHTATLLDAETLEVMKVFEATGSINGGEEQGSKVGGIVELGTKLYMVLKDVNAIWEIETSDPSFPIRKFENLGDGQTPLHDAYLTPDGNYLIAAVQGANVAWVLDTETGKEVAEVPTGETPHTGPGATVGNLTFVPTLDPDGVISVIDTESWTNVKNIDVGGPSLFIRHNPTAANADEYPYVWGETAFGDHHDEIYVIDTTTIEIVETLRPVPGESSWHPEFTYDGQSVYVVSQTGNAIVVYDAYTFAEIARIDAVTPSAVFNMGIRAHEAGL